jgi:diguanylate cyclase (GGDEF)-like protein
MTGPYPRQDGSPPPGEGAVKVAGRDDDPVDVDEAAATGRPAVLGGLFRTLAEDDERVAYWVRHVRSGVVLSELSAVAAFVYALLTHSPGRHSPFILALAAGVVVGSPVLLVLPHDRWMRDRRGPLLFYVWTLTVTVVISAAARLDGGASSPLFALLFVTLAYMAVAYPPQGVALMGAVMTGCYVFVVALPALTTSALFFTAVIALYTMICVLTSANAWSAQDQQVALLRLHESLAATDPLTGCPNRRAFLDRLSAGIAAADRGAQAVVCLIDLDGFKAVNDRNGHAAGDAVLRSVTTALTGAVRGTDTVARLGGDEFAVLAEVSATFPAGALAERLRGAVAAAGASSGVTGSVGVALVFPDDDADLLLHRADAAMYRAKTAGGNRVTVPVG